MFIFIIALVMVLEVTIYLFFLINILGVFMASASNVTILSSKFDRNHANVDGGAFKIDSGGTLIMDNC